MNNIARVKKGESIVSGTGGGAANVLPRRIGT